MLHRNISRGQLGTNIPFEIIPGRRSFTVACPKCVDGRRKSSARSLMVYRDEDKMIRYQCHHPGCEWTTMQSMVDDDPQSAPIVDQSPSIMPIPVSEEIPETYNGDTLYWYRDVEGRPLFANRRINLQGGKVYVPFVYTSEGFVTGKNATWPKDFKGLYGAETIKDKDRVVIVEGEKAAEAAKKIFPKAAVVSWLGGANRGYSTADWSVLKSVDTALLWPDNDEAGKKAMDGLSGLLPCKVVKIAEVSHLAKGADLGDNLTTEEISIAIKSARELSTGLTGVWSLEQIEEQLENLPASRSTGYEVFDAHTKMPGSGLVVIEGRTKHGKSALAVALSSSMIQNRLASSVVFYSYEMTAAKVFLRYVKSLDPEASFETGRSSEGWKEVSSWISSKRLQLIDQSAQLGIGDVVVAAGKSKMEGSVIIVDYLQIVPMSSGFGRNSRQLMIKEMLDELRVVAHKNNVLVIVLSQLTPDYKDPRHDAPREAKDIHYSADLVLRVWNKAVGEANPSYEDVGGDYIIHTYLNRDGESNVVFAGTLQGGSRLQIKRRVKN